MRRCIGCYVYNTEWVLPDTLGILQRNLLRLALLPLFIVPLQLSSPYAVQSAGMLYSLGDSWARKSSPVQSDRDQDESRESVKTDTLDDIAPAHNE